MAKVITFNTKFPAYHNSMKGEPTHFVEKLLLSFIDIGEISISRSVEIAKELNLELMNDVNKVRKLDLHPKVHTIRGGHRFKAGDLFSPRIWTGKPYNSKQFVLAHDVEVKQTWHFEILDRDVYLNHKYHCKVFSGKFHDLALNDGLTSEQLKQWFKYPKLNINLKDHQIICWCDEINYL